MTTELAYIRFLSEADEERGFAELMRRTELHAFPEGVYGVNPEALSVLDDLQIRYRRATGEEVSANVPPRTVRNPVAAPVQ
jgi:hypothetical protein